MSKDARIVAIITGSILAFLFAIFFFISKTPGYDASMVMACVIFAVALIVFQICRNFLLGMPNGWFQVDLMFLIMFFLVHFWFWIAQQFDLGEMKWMLNAYLGSANYSIALATLGMSSFILGFNIRAREQIQPCISLVNAARWKSLGYVVFYAGVTVTCFYLVVVGPEALEGGYSGSAVGNLLARSSYLLEGILLKLGILILLISYANPRKIIPQCKLPLFILSLILIMYLVMGDRSEFFFTIAVVIFAYSRYYKKISFPVLIIGILVSAFLMNAVQLARRDQDRSLNTIAKVMTDDRRNVSVTAGLNNIAASGGVLLAAVSAIAEKHEYFYGELKTKELLGIIPYGRTFFLGSEPAGDVSTSSDFLTHYILGPHSNTGTGTTIVADLYIDFGPAGVVLGLFLLGYIANTVNMKADRGSSIIYAVVFCYFAGLLVMLPRYSFLMIIRGLIWPALIIWALSYLVVGGRRKLEESKSKVVTRA